MSRISCRAARTVLLAVAALGFGPGEDPPPKDPAGNTRDRIAESEAIAGFLSVKATVAKPSYRLLEPIVVEFEATNVSEESIGILNIENIYRRYRMRIVDADGNAPPAAQFYQYAVTVRSSRYLRHPPGKGFRESLIANLWFDLTREGQYTIVVDLPFHAMKHSGLTPVAHSNPVTVKVEGMPLLRPE